MNGAGSKSNKTGSSCVILVLSMLVLITAPSSVFARDDNTVALLRKIGKIFAGIAEKASPSVVVLTVEKPIPRGQLEDAERRIIIDRDSPPAPPSEPVGESRPLQPNPLYSLPGSIRTQKLRQQARGLGFIVSNDGHILTCNHLVKGAQKINVKLADRREFEAEVIGTDPDTDIAVVKIDANELPVLKLGDSDTLSVGDWVVGISNTMGLGRAFTHGLVTAKGRMLGMATLEDFVQTSINLQIGDAGGPLLDLDGNVVGIYLARFDGERGTGISFAIPINMAKDIYEQLIETGTVERGFLGVALKDLDAKMAKALDLEKTKGVVIANVIKDSAAEKAGIKRYDVLVEFNSEPVESASRFILRVAALRHGTQVKAVVLRGGQRQNLTVTLGKRPSEQELKSDDAPKEP
jgi:serine protease Do